MSSTASERRRPQARPPQVEVRILGDVEIAVDGIPVRFGGRRERAVLAMLAAHSGRSVGLDTLVDAVWETEPPTTAPKQVRNIVGRLRAILVVDTVPDGYRLDESVSVDARTFGEEIAHASRLGLESRHAEAVRLLDHALNRRRGSILPGFDAPVLRAIATHLQEQCFSARVARAECLLALGENERAISELVVLVADDPLREQTVAKLLTALHRAGRRVEALAAQLGLDPSPDLRSLHAQILADDQSPAQPPRSKAEPARSASSPSTSDRSARLPLPPPVRHFVGRAEQLRMLDDLLAEQDPTGIVITAIDGTAGIGKTALALQWAASIAHRFPDGCLFLNLRGYAPAGAAMTVAEAVRALLDALDQSRSWLPAEDARALNLYHGLLNGRRILILLDNARDADQVRPFLPRTVGSLAVVTSRRRLTGLAVAEGAHQLSLDLLTPEEGHELLVRRLGAERLAADLSAADAILDACARLPLALSIAASYAAGLPDLPLARLADQLRNSRDRLDVLETGDPLTDVRAVFSWSYSQLEPEPAHVFRLLGLAPGPEVSVQAVAALAGIPSAKSRQALAELTRASLLSERAPGRYALHDLLRAYAAEIVAERELPEQIAEAVRRVLEHHLSWTSSADRILHPFRDPVTAVDERDPGDGLTIASTSSRRGTPFAEHRAALARFERDHAAVTDAVGLAARHGLAGYAWRIAWCSATYFQRRGHWADWEQTHRIALVAAERASDLTGRLHAHRGLARVRARFGAFDEAAEHVNAALKLALSTEDSLAHARVLVDRSWMFEVAERPQEALADSREALELFRTLGHEIGIAESLNTVGWYLTLNGDDDAALLHCEQALERLQMLGHSYGEAGTWDSLGLIHLRLGNPEAADHCYRRAIELFRAVGDRTYEAGSLERLGDIHRLLDPTGAQRAWGEALEILESVGHPDIERLRGKLAPPPIHERSRSAPTDHLDD